MTDLTTQLVEDLRKWVKEKWVDIGAPKKGGGYKPCGRSKGEKRKGYPKCVPAAKAAGMSKKQKKSAVRRKRAAGNPGGKPTMVSTFKKANKKREAFDLLGQVIEGKLCPKGKAAAKRKYDVYPSAYANMYASAVCSGKVKPGGKKKREAYDQLGDVVIEALNSLDEGPKATARRKKIEKGMSPQKLRVDVAGRRARAAQVQADQTGQNVDFEAGEGPKKVTGQATPSFNPKPRRG